MADVRPTSNLPAVAAPTPARTSEAVRAAQRAFFNAALTDGAAPPATRQATPAAATAAPAATFTAPPVSRTVPAPTTAAQADPSRPLRPGSLLDIRI